MYSKLKLLLSFRWYNAWGQFIEFSRNFRFLIVVGRIFRLVEFSGFLRCKVDFSGNFRLLFRVRATCYRAFLLIIGGSK